MIQVTGVNERQIANALTHGRITPRKLTCVYHLKAQASSSDSMSALAIMRLSTTPQEKDYIVKVQGAVIGF